MPVKVATAGAVRVSVEFRSPPVKRLSVEAAAIGLVGLGKMPKGLALVDLPRNDGAVPACTPMLPLPIKKLPKNQSNPRALLSFWLTSTNFASMLTWGGA